MKISVTLEDGSVYAARGQDVENVLDAVLKAAGLIGENDSVRIVSDVEQYILDKSK